MSESGEVLTVAMAWDHIRGDWTRDIHDALLAIANGKHTVVPTFELAALRDCLAAAERILRMYADAPEGSISGEFARGYFGEKL